MATLYKRTAKVVFPDLNLSFEGLRVSFKICKTLKKEPNTLDLKVYNMSERTRSALQRPKLKVILSAGYPSNSAVIFSGEARTVDPVRDGADWVTHIQCGDGEREYQFARVSESFGPGTQIADVIRTCAKSLGINLGNLEDVLAAGGFRGNLTQFAHGYTVHGKASVELDALLRSVGLAWSVQNGVLQVLKGGATSKGSAVLLTPETGMIGSPDHSNPDKKGKPPVLKVKSLLQPAIHCGGRVEIRADGVKGQFRCEKVEHEGDTHGAGWYTTLEAKTAP
jgi:hypothetical protein